MTEQRNDQSKFERLKAKLAKQGASDPAGLAAWICRKKHGAKGLAGLAATGKRAAK